MDSKNPVPDNEQERLKALKSYDLLDTAAEKEFDRLTELASLICGVPIALVSLIDERRQWFKSKLGLEVSETPRNISVCQFAIMGDTIFEVSDALADDRFKNNPLVTGAPDIRFYAGCPLIDKNGYALGTLCVIDKQPKKLSSDQQRSLALLAEEVVSQIVSRKERIELQKSAEFQNIILNGTDYAIIATDPDGIITNFNKGAEEMLGYKAEDLIYMQSPAIFHDPTEIAERAKVLSNELNKKLEAGFDAFVAKSRLGIPDVNEWTYIDSKGVHFRVLLSVTTLYDANKEIQGYLGIARDITESVSNRELLKLSEEKHRKIFENAQGLMCTHDKTGRFLNINIEGARLLGYTPEELFYKTLFDITPPNIKRKVEEYIEKVYANGRDEGLMQVVHKNGTVKMWFYKNMLITDTNGEKIIVGNAIDITERISTEKELKKSKLIAEKSLVAKDEFLANMSHEIRTPMNAILGFTDILKSTKLDQEQSEYLSAISNSGENLMVIINDILDFSKIESGNLQLEISPINIVETLSNVQKLLSHKAKDKNLSFNFNLDDNIPVWLYSDSVRLNQIFINLLGNAIKFTQQGKVELRCRLVDRIDETCQLEFIITDTGIGVPADKFNLIFERFKQADGNTTRKFGGTGLGLSITRKLVELFGGNISVKSKEGLGSEFSVLIPFRIAEKPAPVNPSGNKTLHQSRKLNILLTEDNELNQKFAKHILVSNKMNVELASNGQIAIDKLKNGKFDIILMDLQMPVMDGYVATSFIRNVLKLETPIIAMSAHSLLGEKEKCFNSGMNDYISKPYKAQELMEKIYLQMNDSFVIQQVTETSTLENGIYNMKDIIELSGGDTDFVKEMIRLFITQIPAELQNLKDLQNRSEINEVKKVAHKIRSSFNLFKAKHLADLCSKIEQEEDVSAIQIYINQITEASSFMLKELLREAES